MGNIKNLYETDLDHAVKQSKRRWYAFGCVDWSKILKERQYPNRDIEKYKDTINWNKVWKYQKVSREFLLKYRSRINFDRLCLNSHLTPDIIKEFEAEFLDTGIALGYNIYKIYSILRNPNVSAATKATVLSIDKYDINRILQYNQFSSDIINLIKVRRYGSVRNILSQYHKLTPEFMLRNKDALNWRLISRYQDLPLSFIEQNESSICWKELSYNKHLSYDIVVKYRTKLVDTEEINTIIEQNRLRQKIL